MREERAPREFVGESDKEQGEEEAGGGELRIERSEGYQAKRGEGLDGERGRRADKEREESEVAAAAAVVA